MSGSHQLRTVHLMPAARKFIRAVLLSPCLLVIASGSLSAQNASTCSSSDWFAVQQIERGGGRSGHRANSPMRSRLAAISLGYKQPKTRPRVGTKTPVRSLVNSLSRRLVQKAPVRSGPRFRAPLCKWSRYEAGEESHGLGHAKYVRMCTPVAWANRVLFEAAPFTLTIEIWRLGAGGQ